MMNIEFRITYVNNISYTREFSYQTPVSMTQGTWYSYSENLR